jgi:hypothetical protein
MSIESAQDLIGLQRAGAVTRKTIEAMKAAALAGISTRELDNIGTEVMRFFVSAFDPIGLWCVVAYVVSSVEGARDVSSFASEDHISGVRLDGAQEVHQSYR